MECLDEGKNTATAFSSAGRKMYANRPGDTGIEHNWQWGKSTGVVILTNSSGYPDTCGM